MEANLLSDMAVFAAVVEQNGFSTAAESLQMSKSNVSRRVGQLEDRLGVTLMHRTTRRLTLTESGRVYYEHCARLVSEAEDADQAIKAIHSRPSGELNVSLPETLGRAFILPLLPEFMKSHPDVRLNLTITSRKIDFREHRCDVAVRKGEIEDDSLCAVSLGSSTQYFYASPAHLASAPKLTHPEQLTQHAYLSSKISIGLAELTVKGGSQVFDLEIKPRLSVKDHEALLSMTLADLGVALLPAWMTHDHIRRGELVRVLPDYSGPSVEFNVVFQPHKGMAPNLRVFVDFLKAKFKLNRPWERDENMVQILKAGNF
ncbi:MAG: LysR family transcriptional regulator [Rhizobiaceae bacterium]